MNENNKPIININHGPIGVAIFESTRDTEYGKRTSYNCVLHKGVKNKQTDQWDEYKIALFDDQILPTAELLRIAFAAIIKAKSNPRSGQPVTTQGDQRLDEIGDDIPF